MKYLLPHVLNLYVLPFIEFGIMISISPSGDTGDMMMSILFGYIPIGCFIISFLYGMRKRNMVVTHSFSASLLCIFTVFFPFVTGEGYLERLYTMMRIGFSYFAVSLIGGIAGIIVYELVRYIRRCLRL